MREFAWCILFVWAVYGDAMVGVTVDSKTGDYTVTVGGTAWYKGGDVMVRSGGKAHKKSDGSLTLKAVTAVKGSDALGDWTGYDVEWAAGSASYVTSFHVHPNHIVFQQRFPVALTGTATSTGDLATLFPSFHSDNATGPARGYLAYSGGMVGTPHGGSWSSHANIPGGLEDSGPVGVFTEDLKALTVMSPYNNFMSASRLYDTDHHTLGFGVMGGVSAIPAGYTCETIMTFSASGLNKGFSEWGDALLRTYNKPKDPREIDFTLRYLGYSTDNGAYYYYHTEKGKNYEETLIDVQKYSQRVGIPYRYVLLDSWWYFKGTHDGVKNWTAMPSIFPHNLTYLYEKTGWPIQGHNRFWSEDTSYAKQNGGAFDFIIEKGNKQAGAIPTSQHFWDWLLGESRKWGLMVYEQDWLFNEFSGMNCTLSSATLAREWLLQMGLGASRNGLTIQYCMSWGRHILQSVEIPPVTNARASGDYSQGRSKQWKVGVSGVFAHAVGIAPSKDNYWSMVDEPGNKWRDTEPYPALQGAVSSLSRGPVAPSDMVNGSNASLIMRCCMPDGLLLSADRPATAVDAQLKGIAFSGTGPSGELWHSDTHISGYRWDHIFAAELGSTYHVTPTTIGYTTAPGPMVAYRNSGQGSPAQFDQDHPLSLSKCGMSDFHLYHTAPVFPNGWSLMGETDKWIRVSKSRFQEVDTSGTGLTVNVRGVSGEKVAVEFRTPDNHLQVVSCVFGETGSATVRVPAGTCV